MSDSWRPRQSRSERLARTQLSMTPGTVGGRVAQARPVQTQRRQSDGSEDVTEALFSYPTVPNVNDESPPYYNRIANADLGTLIIATRANTAASSTVALLLNGTQVAALTLPAGEKKNEMVIEDVVAEYGDLLSVKMTAVAPGLDGVTIQVLLEG